MEKNVFWQNRKAIQAICKRDNVDVDVATRKFIHEAKLTDYGDDWADWQMECRKYMKAKDKTLADLFR